MDEIVQIMRDLYEELFAAGLSATERRQVEAGLRKVRAIGFKLPETDFKLRRAQQFPIWKDAVPEPMSLSLFKNGDRSALVTRFRDVPSSRGFIVHGAGDLPRRTRTTHHGHTRQRTSRVELGESLWER
jgi:hypothetical protein